MPNGPKSVARAPFAAHSPRGRGVALGMIRTDQDWGGSTQSNHSKTRPDRRTSPLKDSLKKEKYSRYLENQKCPRTV